jgi:crotonobetainyl-CoA:carnitine CoA-transferase CaiB-like acyl-CoA transferase
MLADLGADVVKVEAPSGDVTRTVPPVVSDVSVYYAQLNAGKRNVGLDLKAPGGSEVIARLAGASDVLLENFRPGVLARYHLDAATLRAANPRLIYCSVTGWGQDGPWVNRRAYAPLVHAEVGMLEMGGRVRGRRPEQEVNQHGDVYPALMATNAVLAALVQRATTGVGQHLDVAMGQALVYVNEWAAVGLQRHRGDHGTFSTWTHWNYRVGDGSYIALVGNPVRLFPAWVRCLGGDPALLDDPRFVTEESRAEHLDEVVAAIDSMTSGYPNAASIEAVLDPSMLAGPVRSVADLAESDWARHRGLTVEVAPGLPVPAAPWQSDGSSVGVGGEVASLGAHNREVLTEIGYGPSEIDALVAAGVLIP